MITEQERIWTDQALVKLYEGELTPMGAAKVMRTISQIFDRAATKIELNLVDTVEDRLYNTNTETKERNYA